jgi:methionyl-tRNA formyltransferase
MKINRIIYLGTPEFSVPALIKISQSGYKPILCITQPDKPQGRKLKLTAPPLKIAALDLNIRLLQPENINNSSVIKIIKELDPELIITAAYGGYLCRELRKIPQLGAINIHPSLLPRYRGASPVYASLLAGDKFTGITIFRLIAKMDAGPIIFQSKYQIKDDDNFTELQEKLAYQAADDLLKLINHYENGIVTETRQDQMKATYCEKLSKKDLSLNWHENCNKIHNQVRALSIKPAANTCFRGKPAKIIATKITDEPCTKPPGTVLAIDKKSGILVAAGDCNIWISKLQIAGKKIMAAYEFHLGAHIKTGEIFGDCDAG